MRILHQRAFLNCDYISSLPYSALDALKEKNVRVRREWLSHSMTPCDVLAAEESRLAGSAKANEERAVIAGNPNCPASLMKKMLETGNEKVLCALSKNPNTPAAILLKLAASKLKSCHLGLSRHANTPYPALQYVAAVSSDPLVLRELAMHPACQAKPLNELLKPTSDGVPELVAQYSKLEDGQILKAWKIGGSVRYALMKNPHITPETLSGFIPLLDNRGLSEIATNPALPAMSLSALAEHRELRVQRAVAANPSTPEKTLSRLSERRRGNVQEGVAENPAASARMLHPLASSGSESVRVSVAKHPNVGVDTLGVLSDDPEISVREAVAKSPNLSASLLRKMASDACQKVAKAASTNPQMGVISTLKGFDGMLREQAHAAFSFYQEMSPKRSLKKMINSKHPTEVSFVFDSGSVISLQTITALQNAFTNPKGKLDRDGYLTMLQRIKEWVPVSYYNGIDVEPQPLQSVMKHFGTDLILEVMMQFCPTEARDVFRMLHSLVSLQNKRVVKEHVAWVRAWLDDPEGLENEHAYTDFHSALNRKTRNISLDPRIPFYQQTLTERLPAATSLLPDGWSLDLPTNAPALLAIGDAQRHCVGTIHYAQRCAVGASIIFQLVSPKGASQGYTFDFSRSGRLQQAKGFANCDVPSEFIAIGKQVFCELVGKSQERLGIAA